MAEPIVAPSVDGQEVQLADVDNIGAVAGLADDRVLAELLRLTPYDGTNVYKAIIPYSTAQSPTTLVPVGAPTSAPIVQPNGASGSVLINPFRAVVGSRNTPSAAPSPNPAVNYQADTLANWRDIRSGIFVNPVGSSLAYAIALAANSSGNPRFDLIYATVAVDGNGPSVSRRVKNPSTGSIATQSVPAYLTSAVTVNVVQGTAGSNPALPSLPSDSSGNYCIPLAYVWVPNGFTSTSTVNTKDIRPSTFGSSGLAISRVIDPFESFRVEPASANNDQSSNLYVQPSGPFAWVTGPGRPGVFMPPTWVGGRQIIAEIDVSNATTGNWSHQTTGVVDASMDWRKRMVLTFCQGGANTFGNDSSGGNDRTPLGIATAGQQNWQMANTFAADANYVASSSTLISETNANNSSVAAAATVALYVSQTDGSLRVYITGTPTCRLFFWIMATAQFPNY